ncbi:MAG: PKD domain-containing protein [Methanospirillaceae archaeon]|nr:PKD domain-containing protein [Methanospirillaceae archaeon]
MKCGNNLILLLVLVLIAVPGMVSAENIAATIGITSSGFAVQSEMESVSAASVVTATAENVMASSTLGSEVQVTYGAGEHVKPDISSGLVVYEKWASGNSNVEAYSIASGSGQPITTGSTSQTNPAVDSSYIVWEGDTGYVTNIYAYIISTGVKGEVLPSTAYERNPSVSGTLVVWEDYRGRSSDIYIANLATGVAAAVCTDGQKQINPDISGTKLVWEDWRNGNADIYLFDLETNTEKQLTTDGSNQVNPKMYGNLVVWEDFRNGKPDIYAMDIRSNVEARITFDSGDQINPDVYGTSVVWEDWRDGSSDIYMRDLSTTTIYQITDNDYNQVQPAIYGDRIVWSDNRNGNSQIYMTSLGTPVPPTQTYEFYGLASSNGQPVSVGSTIIAAIDGKERGRIVTTVQGQYGSEYGPYLQVPVSSADYGKSITFWINNVQTTQVVAVATPSRQRVDLTIGQSPVYSYQFYGKATINNQPAPVGTVIQATINNENRGQITISSPGYYGSASGQVLTVGVTNADVGKVITFWANGIQASQYVVVGQQYSSCLDLTFGSGPVTNSYKFYGTVTIDGYVAPVGTVIQAMVNGVERGRTTVAVPGQYGSAGGYSNNLEVPFTSADAGRYITFLVNGRQASQQVLISTGGTYMQDLTVYGSSTMADFTATPTSGYAPLSVSFTDRSAGSPLKWYWAFGDGSYSYDRNPTHTYSQAGTYTVIMSVTYSSGTQVATKNNYITVSTKAPSATLTLYPGWNFIATPKTLAEGYDTASLFSNIDVAGHSIFQYDSKNGRYKSLNAKSPIKPLDAVWIYSSTVNQVYLYFAEDALQIPPTKTVSKGWNTIGISGLVQQTAYNALLSVKDDWVYLIGFDPGTQTFERTIMNVPESYSAVLQPGKGFWLYMNEEGVLAGSGV